MITSTHIICIIATMALLLAIGVWTGRKVNDAHSFATGGKAGTWMVCGVIMGTLVGGQSTIGTAQMAFSYGLSAWWFTIGTSLGALVLALCFVGPLRRSGSTTLTEIIAREYGRRAERVGTVLCMIGIFISIVAQILSSSAMMGTLFGTTLLWSSLISAAFIVLFVLFGGIKSAGAGGIVKLALLYFSSIAAGVVVLQRGDGYEGLQSSIATMLEGTTIGGGAGGAEALHQRYNSLTARGAAKDIGAAFSLILGVLSTQTYAQAVWSARGDKEARRGAWLCTLFTPLIGGACTLVGLYMRGHYITAEEQATLLAAGGKIPEGIGILEETAQAFPVFIKNHLPAWAGGIVLGTLFVTILGGGSGLALGAATIFVRDIYNRLPNRHNGAQTSTRVYRTTLVAMLAIGVVVAIADRNTYINDLGFLSLGLRATALLFPLCCALFFAGRFGRNFAVASMIVGTAVMLAAYWLRLPLDPSYWGLCAGLIVMACGMKKRG